MQTFFYKFCQLLYIAKTKVGLFQKDIFEAKKMELLIKKFNTNVNPIKQKGFNELTWNAITKYCNCKGLLPSKYREKKI